MEVFMLSYKNSTKELLESGTDTAILSVGATEQIGPYLPMHLDTLIVELYAEAYVERVKCLCITYSSL